MSTTILDFRGRDLALLPPAELQALPTPQLLNALCGPHLPGEVRGACTRDTRGHFLRTKPIYFNELKRALLAHGTPFRIAFEERQALPFTTNPNIEPRPYQEEALAKWREAHEAGVVVLPTGAGKTLVAALAIHALGLWTLAVVPTLDLLAQWRVALASALSLDPAQIGVFGGGAKELEPITIMTYDSAALYPRELRRFGLLVFDECHHLPASTYRQIAESAFTPLRLGLSATPERADMAHADLAFLIGPEVYRRSPAELTGDRYLAQYREERISIALSPEDEALYTEQRQIYRNFLQRRRILISSPEEFQRKV